ncbi:MAG: hypothetical protein J7647_00635 [Cyanobacteria bacterium SBLK]|nr:hypothetical protein [Cyanobacteria bacterium SBLK]
MPYRQFTIAKAVDNFQLDIVEGDRFFPEIAPINPSSLLAETLKENIPWAIAVGSEKARSEGIINPVLLEVKRQLKGQISVFSGEEFSVTIYRTVTSGTVWRFLKLEGQTVAIDLNDYLLPPVEQILGVLVWMLRDG